MQQEHNVERCIGEGDVQCGHHIQGHGGRTAGACRVAQGHKPPHLGCEDGLHMPFSQLGSQNEDGVHAGTWWRPPKLILTS